MKLLLQSQVDFALSKVVVVVAFVLDFSLLLL